jgi:UDP-4-amino-4,6-dideoxy-L-N-acetyl-beta-L-altrosamine transaminase
MSNLPFIPYARQSIDANDLAGVNEALLSPMITRGSQVEAFEKEIAVFCGAQYAVAFNSATSALIAASFAAKADSSDRVITTSNSFIASVSAPMRFGAAPVFVDIDPQTGNASLEQLAITANISSSRGKPIIVPVHFAGVAMDIEQLDRSLTNPDAIIIEDAAHALGSFYPNHGPRVGSCAWSAMTVFSFHPAKTMTTGEGGMVTTNDEELYRRLKLYRNNGIERDPKHLQQESQPWYYEIQEISDNHNFTEFQAALGRSQLKRIDAFISKRLELMRAYKQKLADNEHIRLLTPEIDLRTCYHLCVVQIDFEALNISRAELMKKLLESQIGTQVHYIPLYRHPYFVRKYGDVSEYFPHTEKYYSQALTLPLYYDLTVEDVERVIHSLKTSLKK